MSSWRSEFGDQFEGSRALVTGATGFLGWHLSGALVELGANVNGLSRRASTVHLPAGVSPKPVDLSSDQRFSTLEDEYYDYVFHLAGVVTGRPDPELIRPTMNSNLIGTVNLLEIVRQRGWGRTILTGSSTEGTSAASVGSPYATSKLAADAYAHLYSTVFGIQLVRLRLFMTFGPRQDDTKVVPHVISSLLYGENVPVSSGTAVCDAIYVEDAVRAMLMGAVADVDRVQKPLDVGRGTGLTLRELLTQVEGTVGPARGKIEFGALSERPNEPGLIADVDRTDSLIGWRPAWSIADGLAETVDWYRSRVPQGASV